MDADKLPQVFAKFRGQPIDKIESGYMKSELLRVINEVTSQYNLMDLVGDKRQEINTKVFKGFNESLFDFGVVVETMNISDAVPDTATAEAIQNVINAQNKLQQATIEKQTAEQEAEKRIVEAKGKAESVRIEAEAQAKANELLEHSLTDNIVKNKAIEKWDGKMPQVNGGGNMMFNIPIDR
jgi:regulator of protease activity HflC (stomatin/prohibitin superfamily)